MQHRQTRRQHAPKAFNDACNRRKMANDKERTLEFIEDYRSYQVLWDPKHSDYTNKTKRKHALTALSRIHNIDVASVKNKIKSLRSYFSKEHQKVAAKRSGGGIGESYQSSWFAYNSLSFIIDSVNGEFGENTTLEDHSKLTAQDENDSYDRLSEHEYEFVQPPRAKRNPNSASRDDRDEKPKTMKMAEELHDKNECAIFAKLVEHKLRKLNPRNQLLAERRINEVLFDLEMRELGEDTAASRGDDVVVTVVPQPKYSPD